MRWKQTVRQPRKEARIKMMSLVDGVSSVSAVPGSVPVSFPSRPESPRPFPLLCSAIYDSLPGDTRRRTKRRRRETRGEALPDRTTRRVEEVTWSECSLNQLNASPFAGNLTDPFSRRTTTVSSSPQLPAIVHSLSSRLGRSVASPSAGAAGNVRLLIPLNRSSIGAAAPAKSAQLALLRLNRVLSQLLPPPE